MSESESEPKYYKNITNSNLLLPDRSNIKFTSVNSNLGSNLSKEENEPMVKQFTDGCYLMNRLGVSDREFNKGNCLFVKGNSTELLFNLYYPSGWELTENFINTVDTTTTVTVPTDNPTPSQIKGNKSSNSIDYGKLYYMKFVFSESLTDETNSVIEVKTHYSLFELEEGFGNLCYDACGNSIISIKSSNIDHKTDDNKYITNDLKSNDKLIKNNYLNMVGYNIAHNIFSSQSYLSNNKFYSIHSLYVPTSKDDKIKDLEFNGNDYIITYSQDFKNKNLEKAYVLYYGNIVYDDKSYFAKTKYSKFSASCIHFHIDNIQLYDTNKHITEVEFNNALISGVTFKYKLTIFYLDSYNSSTKIELDDYYKFGSIDFIYELPDKSNIITGIMLEIIPNTTEPTITNQLSIKLENPNLNVWDFNEIGTKFVDKENVKLYIPRKVEA